MNQIVSFIEEFYSIIIAIIRLLFLVCATIASGLQIILFTRTEICNIEMRGMAWRCDREKMADQISFVDKICLENPDLLDFADEQMQKEQKGLPPEDEDDEGI